MDINTVQEIIEMIDARLANLENTTMHIEDYLGADRALTELQNHLQSFIDEPDEDVCQCCGGHINMCDEECTQILNKTEA